MKLNNYRNIILLCFVPFLILKSSGIFNQRPGKITWANEQILYSKGTAQTHLFFPIILADQFGLVHVLWTEGSKIYYIQKNEMGWSLPTDIWYIPDSHTEFLSAIVDEEGILHLVWEVFGNIYYKWVPAWQAPETRMWSRDRVIGNIGRIMTPLKIGLDEENGLHIIFSDWVGREGLTTPGNLYHFSSNDGGKTWSGYHQIASVPTGQVAVDPRMAFDNRGHIHIVWGQWTPRELALQHGVYYSRFSILDQAATNPRPISLREEHYTTIGAINVIVGKDDHIHTIWACGEVARRCQSYSIDGGDTWQLKNKIFGDLVGLSGWDALFKDGAGNLYWMGVLRYPQAMYYAPMIGTGPMDPPLIASLGEYMRLGENIIVAVGLGNEVHVVVNLGDKIIYMFGETSADKHPALLKPNSTERIITEATHSASQRPDEMLTSFSTDSVNTYSNNSVNETNPNTKIILESVSLTLFILLILIYAVKLKRRTN
jgi:hypothetical protein